MATPPAPARIADLLSTQNDIASVVSALAGRQGDDANSRKLTGPEPAAVLMLALGEQYGARIWNMLDDDELKVSAFV